MAFSTFKSEKTTSRVVAFPSMLNETGAEGSCVWKVISSWSFLMRKRLQMGTMCKVSVEDAAQRDARIKERKEEGAGKTVGIGLPRPVNASWIICETCQS
jgi:hypothetical protein